jgi:hypothetical protein
MLQNELKKMTGGVERRKAVYCMSCLFCVLQVLVIGFEVMSFYFYCCGSVTSSVFRMFMFLRAFIVAISYSLPYCSILA